MAVLAGALAALLAILTLLLAVPLVFVVDVEGTGTVRVRWRVRWLFGLVDFTPGRRRAPPRERRPKTAGSAWRSVRMLVAAIGAPGFVGRVARLLADLRRRVRCERFHLHAEFGLDDPADTGRIYGALTPVLLAASAHGLDIRCQPSFLHAALEGSCGATLHVRPLSIIGLVVGFVCSPSTVRAMRAAWRSRR